MAVSVQARGRRFQLRVTHKLLSRPFFWTFDDEASARGYGQQLAALLERGIVPAELMPKEQKRSDDPLVAEVVRAYMRDASHLTASDEKLLTTMLLELPAARVGAVDYAWVQSYVRRLKLERRLTPGTIRKRVGALGRVFDWHLAQRVTMRSGQSMPPNPFRLLPIGYSQYTPAEAKHLEARGASVRVDQKRDRRLLPAEERRVRDALAGRKRDDRERPWPADDAFRMLFELILWTGLRLREAYRLRVDQVDMQRGVLRVEGSKGARGALRPRVVPLRPELRAELERYVAGRVGLLFPYWDGSPSDLDRASARLSHRFRTLFDYAQVEDFSEHDLRHEATCRWFELRRPEGGWVFSDVEICRIMGWSTPSMALRYASLRGEDLAARLASF